MVKIPLVPPTGWNFEESNELGSRKENENLANNRVGIW